MQERELFEEKPSSSFLSYKYRSVQEFHRNFLQKKSYVNQLEISVM